MDWKIICVPSIHVEKREREKIITGVEENELMWQLIFRDIYLCISLSPKIIIIIRNHVGDK